jgi:2',3'-cyclic-nucleotide 2'-phosphodiesterase (5'-nucleotidase family)
MHISTHNKEVEWIKTEIEKNNNKKIIIGTHFPPTSQLIEKKYYLGDQPSDWYYTNVEYMIKKPIIAWFAGHSHSVIDKNINDVFCAINVNNNITKTFIY